MSSMNPDSMSIGQRHGKFCLFTHRDARRIAGDWTGASTSRRIGCLLARIAFSEAQRSWRWPGYFVIFCYLTGDVLSNKARLRGSFFIVWAIALAIMSIIYIFEILTSPE